MKRLLAILFLGFIVMPASAQYFLRGEVKDAQGNTLAYASIRLASKGSALFTSGSSGGFGIPLSAKQDTITVMLDGYETLSKLVSVASFQTLVLKDVQRAAEMQEGNGLMSLTKNMKTIKSAATVTYGGETYTSLAENEVVKASDAAETTLALNINSASYSNIRRFLNMGSEVPPDGVRIEEMLNYFNLNKRFDDSTKSSFHIQTQLTSCPWDTANNLLFISVHAPKLKFANVTPAKFIFLIDISGSMDKDNRLPLVQAAFKFLVNNLRAEDTVGIVTYGGYVGIALPPTSGSEKDKIISVIDALRADGDTPGSAAIQTAYQLAEKIYNPRSNNRVILATDGDFNIGQTSDEDLENIVSQHKEKGIYLTCLGTGMGNYKDSRLEALAKKANGNFAYIDNLEEAQKTMVTEFTKNMYSVANNTLLSVRFNAAVKEYRLIGYDNRRNAVADSTRIEGGELGSGQGTMAVFEINRSSVTAEPLATIQLRYHTPQNNAPVIKSFLADNHMITIDSADADLKLAASVCMFGSLLKHSKYAGNISWDETQRLAESAADKSQVSEREFVELVIKAKEIYTENAGDKKKKKYTH